PAPFLPRKPKMDAFGTCSVTPRSASAPSAYRLWRSEVSMTNASVMLCSRFGQAGQLGFERPADFFVAQPLRPQLFDRTRDDGLSEPHPVGRLLAPCRTRDE